MLPILVGTAIAFAVMALVIGTTVTVDNYLCKRKRIREINERHEERMSEISVRHAEFMLRMGMNPDYISRNLPMCTASRGNLTTFGRERWLELHSTELTDMPAPAVYTPEEAQEIMGVGQTAVSPEAEAQRQASVNQMREDMGLPRWDGVAVQTESLVRFHDTELTDLPAPAVYTPEEAIAIELSAHWNERIKESLPDDAEVHSVEASIPGWDGTFINLDVDAIPAPELFSVKEEENAS